MDNFFSSEILKSINKAKNHIPSPPYIVMPQWWVKEESAACPNNFIFHNDSTVTWCGYIVYTYGDRYETD